MITVHRVQADQVEPQPWRNGGGRTRELLAWPGARDWSVRVSVADVERDGPFSPFPGVTRRFAVLEGAGVVLAWPGRELRVTRDGDPVTFDGVDAPECALVAGPTRDLNLMTRGGRSRMERVVPGSAWDAAAALAALFTTRPGTWACAARRERVGAGTLLWSAEPSPDAWAFSPSSHGDEPCGWWLAWSDGE